jgi:hypothetical protein
MGSAFSAEAKFGVNEENALFQRFTPIHVQTNAAFPTKGVLAFESWSF